MGIEFFDSFDSYLNGAADARGYRAGKYIGYGGIFNIVAGRFAGSFALQIVSDNNFNIRGRLYRSRATPSAEFSVGAAIKLSPNLPAEHMLGVGNGAFEEAMGLGIAHKGNGRLAIQRRNGNTTTSYQVLAQTEDYAVQFEQWNHYAFSGRIGASEDLVFALNGFPILTVNDVDTRSSLNLTEVTHIGMAGMDRANVVTYDDLVIRDDALPVPDCRIFTLRPTGDVANSGFTPSTGSALYAMLDEQGPDLTDYISASLAGDYCEMSLGDIPYVPDEIYSVAVRGLASKTDAASRALALGLKTSGGTILNGGETGLPTSAAPIRWQQDVSPDTNAEWTRDEINGLILRPIVTV